MPPAPLFPDESGLAEHGEVFRRCGAALLEQPGEVARCPRPVPGARREWCAVPGWPGRRRCREARLQDMSEISEMKVPPGGVSSNRCGWLFGVPMARSAKNHCLTGPRARKIEVGPTARAPESDPYEPGAPSQTPPALMSANSACHQVPIRSRLFPQGHGHVTMGHERRTYGGGTLRRWRSPQSNGRNDPPRRLRGNTENARAGQTAPGSRSKTAAAPHGNPQQISRNTGPCTVVHSTLTAPPGTPQNSNHGGTIPVPP